MNTKDEDIVIEQYETSCKIIYGTTLSGDYKMNNYEGKKIIKVFKGLEEDLSFTQTEVHNIHLKNTGIR